MHTSPGDPTPTGHTAETLKLSLFCSEVGIGFGIRSAWSAAQACSFELLRNRAPQWPAYEPRYAPRVFPHH